LSEPLLDAMARGSRTRDAALRARVSPSDLFAAARRAPAAPPLRLDGFDLIAEVKRQAPSAGALAPLTDDGVDRAVRQATTYARSGAAAVSVLTEPERFAGAMAHLEAVAAALRPLGVPAMRKDFLVSPLQVAEARVAGAGGVLLIVRMLDPDTLRRMRDLALELGMFVLIEAFDAEDLAAAGALVGPDPAPGQLIGLNTRDLRTLAVDVGRLARLVGAFPPGVPAVAESGLETPGDAARVAGQGYRLALVGSALMRAPDPGALARGLVDAGRHAACG
jgi:indole-3-glycerol phosphate synthase